MFTMRNQHPVRRGADEGSLALAMLLTVLATMFAALLVPVMVTQIHTTRYDARRDHALNAAQAGIEVMLGQIRSAKDSSNAGVLATLPCTTASSGGPLTGAIDSAATQSYTTYVYYFAQDPTGHTSGPGNWIDDTSKQLTCSNSGVSKTPSFADVVSVGTDTASDGPNAAGRTLEATYAFKRTNTNIPGGLLDMDLTSDSNGNPLCLDAGSSSPASGTLITLQSCQSGDPDQTWAFQTNSTISLTSTADAATGALGMCIDTSTHSTGGTLVVKPCSKNVTTIQQWIYGGYGANWHATTSSIGRDDSLCWNAQSPNQAGSLLVLGGCTQTSGVFEVSRSFSSDASFGAGPANAAHKFLVNYNQFGRCLTVRWIQGTQPHLDPSDPNYLPFFRSYPCSPMPDGATSNPPLNQLWNFPTIPAGQVSASGTITSTSTSSGTYCQISPLVNGGYPKSDLCSRAPSNASKTWTFWGDTGNYTTSYRITDGAGFCLQPTDPDVANPDLINGVSKIIVATCSGSTLQKWNAPPGTFASQLNSYHER